MDPISRLNVLVLICLLLSATSSVASHPQAAVPADKTVPDALSSISAPEPARGANPAVAWTRFPSPPPQSLAYISIDVGDINRDGNPDIVAGYDAQGIRIWTGDGTGNWNAFNPPMTNLTFNDIKIGNIDNDGHPDIVGATDIGVYVWTGNSAGSWTNRSPAFEMRPFYSLALDDMNLDGRTDIVAGSKGQGTMRAIFVYLWNRTLGDWERKDANMPNTGTYYGISTGDFNHDGKPDIAGSGNGLNAWTGDGAGGWTVRSTNLPGTGIYSDVELADVNIDGKLDLVATSQNNAGLRVWNGNGAGTWMPTLNLPTAGNYRGVRVADVNIDGYMDIVTACSNSDLSVWTGDALDNWYLQTAGFESGNYHKAISVGDLDSDGRMELCLLNNTGEIDIWSASVEREVNIWSETVAPNTDDTARDIFVGDVNLDGRNDIFYAFGSEGMEIWAGDGNGTWTAFGSPTATGNFNSLISRDYNKDGKPDIISTSDSGIKAWRGDGTGNWTANNPTSNNVWLGLAAADLNRDGNIDIVAGTGTNQGLRQFNGNGAGTWIPKLLVLPNTGNYHSLDIADVNRDGAPDIIAANGGIRIFLGNGNDQWTDSSAGLPGTAEQYTAVKAADINNDGMVDIIGVSALAGANAWLGDGTGQWAALGSIAATHGSGLAVADFSIDGSIDVCVGSATDAGITGRKNSGTAWPDVSQGLSAAGNFTALELADINTDGRLDIITFNNTDRKPYIWTGDYQVPPPSSFTVGPLAVGWNLVSTPLVPINSSLPAALLDLDGDTSWTRVKHYDNSVMPAFWRSYGIGTVSTLSSITVNMGLWLFIPDAAALGDGYIRLEGHMPETSTIVLEPGWNLVGYPSSAPELAGVSLPEQVDMMAIYQPASPYIQDIADFSAVELSPGNGYWMHATATCTLAVDY